MTDKHMNLKLPFDARVMLPKAEERRANEQSTRHVDSWGKRSPLTKATNRM